MSYKKWKEFKFDKEVKKLMYFGKVEDYIAQPDPILVNSEEEALEDIWSRKVAQLSQLKDKVVDAYVSLNEIAQDVMFLNNHHIQPYRDEQEWFKGQEKIANLQSELTVLQPGKEAIVETFSKVAKTLTPVSAQAEA